MQNLWSSGATEGTALRYLLKFSADTSAWSQRRRWLLVCLWLSIETDSRPVQGVEQTLCEEQTHAHTQSLLPAPESGHCESSWHHLLLDVLSLPSSRQSHLIPSDLAQFQSPWKMQSVRHLVLLFPLPNAGTHVWNYRAGIICTVEARMDGGRASVNVATQFNIWTGWFRPQPGIPLQQSSRYFQRFTFSQLYLKKKKTKTF